MSTAVFTTIIGTVALAILTSAWDSKVPRAEYDLHVQQEETRSARIDSMVTDLWCAEPKNATARRCK